MADIPAELKESIDSTKVSYQQLGKSGLRVSVPILGAMSFGSKDWQPWVEDNEEAVNQVSGLQLYLSSQSDQNSSSKAPTIEGSTLGIRQTSTPTAAQRK
jgi:hypothetical protein